MYGYAFFSNKDQYCSSGTWAATCLISQTWRFIDGDSLSGVNMTIANGGLLQTDVGEKMSIVLTGTAQINSGGAIRANLSNFYAAGSIVVLGGGIISADGLGMRSTVWGAALGAGGGGYRDYCGAGGGHGGVGGASTTTAVGGGTFDSSTTPSLFGGAGGGAYSLLGGNGGGLLVLSAGNIIYNEGLISANGLNGGVAGSSYGAGGGAGGSIRISAGGYTTANGIITANGGAGGHTTYGPDNHGGGGGGGRIAITTPSNGFGNTPSANYGAAGGVGAQQGGAGTVVIQ